MDNYYALIMAGGGGTRLWPLSRKLRPKQMLPLIGEDSLFRIAVTRLAPVFTPDRIFIVTGADQVAGLQADVPELPAENFIVEPFGRDSGPAAALGVNHIHSLNPNAVVAILTADHYIRDVWGFCGALKSAYDVAGEGYIVTLGITPTSPATGFGYIQKADELGAYGGLTAYHSAGFKEKPDTETAQRFLDSGMYCWNSGMFIWTTQQAMQEFAKQQPAIHENLEQIATAFGTSDYQATIAKHWPEMTKISLDYAVMENAPKMAIIPVEIGWSDIGSWSAVYEELAPITGANVVMGGQHIALDTSGALINSARLVVTIGLEDVVIIDTDDVLMICRQNNTQDVKRAVEHLKQNGLDSYL